MTLISVPPNLLAGGKLRLFADLAYVGNDMCGYQNALALAPGLAVPKASNGRDNLSHAADMLFLGLAVLPLGLGLSGWWRRRRPQTGEIQ